MSSTSNDDVGIRPLQIPDWSLGINTAQPATEIQDNEAQDILNMEFDDSGNLSSRSGTSQLMSTTFGSRITSLHYFNSEAGEIGILFTTGNTLRIVETDGTGLTNLTGALTLPSDTFWQWTTFGGLAIGVNKATTGDNPVKVNTSSVAAALGGTPPKGKYIEVWNNRVWIASATEPNKVWGSSLNNAEDWTTTGDAGRFFTDIDANDGDQITGLFATRDALYVFKRKRIFRIVPINPAAAPTLASNLRVELYAQNIGCVSPYSIKAVLDDVVFLSEQGLASLKLAEAVEDFRTALFSRNIAEIARTPKTNEEVPGFVIDNASQYILSIPAVISLSGAKQAYVMDYLRINQEIIRWTRFDGLLAGTAYTSFPGSSSKVYIIGAQNAAGTHQLFKYIPRSATLPYSDNGTAYTKQLRTKAYSVNAPLIRKHWHKWGFGFAILVSPTSVSVQYYLDLNTAKGGTQSFNFTGGIGGALWDSALWDVALWDSGVSTPQDVVRRLLSNSSGQKSQNITFLVTNAQNNQAMVIKDFVLWFSMLNEHRVTDV